MLDRFQTMHRRWELVGHSLEKHQKDGKLTKYQFFGLTFEK
jgi:hypothetical protein